MRKGGKLLSHCAIHEGGFAPFVMVLMGDNDDFKNEQYWTAKDKMKVYKNFLASLDKRSLDNMTEKAYLFYHFYAYGFIAHYERRGFASTYSGESFLEFLRHWVDPKYAWFIDKSSDLNRALPRAPKPNSTGLSASLRTGVWTQNSNSYAPWPMN